MFTKMKINYKVLIISLIVVYSVAFFGGLFTSQNVNSEWYESTKTSLTPPNFIFPIVWNILFFLIAISLYLAWTSAKNKTTKKTIAIIFGINLFLNFAWSIIFFGLQNPKGAFIELIVLWISIVAMIYTTYRINKTSSYLLIPYLLWVSFAGILNWMITF